MTKWAKENPQMTCWGCPLITTLHNTTWISENSNEMNHKPFEFSNINELFIFLDHELKEIKNTQVATHQHWSIIPVPLTSGVWVCFHVCVALTAHGHVLVPTDGLMPNVRWEGGRITSRGSLFFQLFSSPIAGLNRLVSLLSGLKGDNQPGAGSDLTDLRLLAAACKTLNRPWKLNTVASTFAWHFV